MKKFRIATEGATTDGRTISRQWLEQMAANYDAKKYGARVNLEHLRGMLPDGPFRAYGDVLALSTEEVDGKLHLLAEINPTDDLVELNKKRQKVYTSMEVDLDFAGTGEAYLVGLAVTDSPASLGTEMLQFSSKAAVNPLASRKQRPENLFSAAIEIALDFDQEDSADDKPSLLDSVKALFSRHKQEAKTDLKAFREDLEKTLELFVTENADLRKALDAFVGSAKFAELKTAHEELQKQFAQLKGQLDKTPETTYRRQVATGSDGAIETDC